MLAYARDVSADGMPSNSADREALAVRSNLTAKDVAAITKKLDRLDANSNVGPWTRRMLQLTSDQSGVVSTVLSRQMGIDRYQCKPLLRQLRNVGLIYELAVGYSLSPRGRAYLRLADTS